jgi:hypothetical protein
LAGMSSITNTVKQLAGGTIAGIEW